MEPVCKAAKYEEANQGSPQPQMPLKIDASQVQKLQKIAQQCEDKFITNDVADKGSTEDLRSKEISAGRKLEMIIGKLTSAEQASAHKPGTNDTAQQDMMQDAACQASLDVQKLVCDVLQKSESVKKHLNEVLNKSMIVSLEKENERLKIRASDLEQKLLKATEKLNKIETRAEQKSTATVTKSTSTVDLSPRQEAARSVVPGQRSRPLPVATGQPPVVTTKSSVSPGPMQVMTQAALQQLLSRPPVYTSYSKPNSANPPPRYPAAQMVADKVAFRQSYNSQQSPRGPTVRSPTHIMMPQRPPAPMAQPQPTSTAQYRPRVPYTGVTRLPDGMWQLSSHNPSSFSMQQVVNGKPYNAVPTRPPLVNVVRAPLPPKIPPAVKLSISNSDAGIVLSWDLLAPTDDASIVDVYHLYACQGNELNQLAPAQWKRIGVVKALPLPMACTLTQFVRGSSYHFVVAAIDKNGVQGDLSNSCTMRLGNG